MISSTGFVTNSIFLMQSWQKDKKFSVSLAYDGLRVKTEKKAWMRMIWRNYIPPKHSFILWLAFCGRLNTKSLWFSETEDYSCSFCNTQCETISHLFFRCTFVKAIWKRIQDWLNITRSMSTLSSAIKWIKKDYKGSLINSKAVNIVLAANVYFVWMARNQILFAGKSICVNAIVSSIQSHVYTVLGSLNYLDHTR